MSRKNSGFTLIELLIVMVIIGMLAALVGPRLFGQLEGSKNKAAKAQVEMISTALDAYRLDVNRYPTTAEGLLALWEKPTIETDKVLEWRGPYLRKSIPSDPWGNAYQYRSPGEKGEFDLFSFGRDGREGGEGEDADIGSW